MTILSVPKLRTEAARLGISLKLPLNKLRAAVTAALEAEAGKKSKPAKKPKEGGGQPALAPKLKESKPKPEAKAAKPKKSKASDDQMDGDFVYENAKSKPAKAAKVQKSEPAKKSAKAAKPDNTAQPTKSAKADWEPVLLQMRKDIDAAFADIQEQIAKLSLSINGDAFDEDMVEDDDDDAAEETPAVPKSLKKYLKQDDEGAVSLTLEDSDVDDLDAKQIGLIIKAVTGKNATSSKLGPLKGELRLLLQKHSSEDPTPVTFTAGQAVIYTFTSGDETTDYQAWIASPKKHGSPKDSTKIRIVFDDDATRDVRPSKLRLL